MIDHMVDAAIYLHEALVDGYEVEPKFLQPARDIKDLALAQVRTDETRVRTPGRSPRHRTRRKPRARTAR